MSERNSQMKYFATGMAVASATALMISSILRKRFRKKESKVQRLGAAIRLRPACYQQYRKLHADVWSSVIKRLRQSNIRNYSIFYLPNKSCPGGVLYSYMEYTGNDLQADLMAIQQDEATREWWKLTEPLQEPFQWEGPPPSQQGTGGNWWEPLECLFYSE